MVNFAIEMWSNVGDTSKYHFPFVDHDFFYQFMTFIYKMIIYLVRSEEIKIHQQISKLTLSDFADFYSKYIA